MRKKLAVSLIVLLVMGLLTGCHGTSGLSAFEMPDEFDESEEIEITFWAKNDTNKTQVAVYEAAIEAFEELYPNITVTIRLYTDYGDIYNDVITNISTGTTPNVCITYPDHIATYLTGENVVVPLDELIADEKYGLGGSELKFDGPTEEEVVSAYLDECVINGSTYALPYMRSTEACYINVDYVEALGYEVPDVLTWDFIWEVSEAAMEQDEDGNYIVNGQSVMIPFIYKSTDNMMIQMVEQLDSGYSTEDGEILLFNDTTEEILMEIAEHAGTGAFSTFKISSYPANFLNAGQCIFAIDSTAGATWMGTDAPLSDISEDKIVEFETAVRAVPQYDTDNVEMISQGPSICIFNKSDEQEVLASWLFAQFLLTNEVQIAYAETEGYVPVTTKAQEDEEYQSYLAAAGSDNDDHYEVKIAATELLLENIDNTFITNVFNGSASLRDAAGALIENVTKSMRRGETVDSDYIDELYESVSALYKLDQQTLVGQDEDLGPLPAGSVALLVTLGVIWVILIAVFIIGLIRKKRS